MVQWTCAALLRNPRVFSHSISIASSLLYKGTDFPLPPKSSSCFDSQSETTAVTAFVVVRLEILSTHAKLS